MNFEKLTDEVRALLLQKMLEAGLTEAERCDMGALICFDLWNEFKQHRSDLEFDPHGDEAF